MGLAKVIDFSQERGYDSVKLLGIWNGYFCYEPVRFGESDAEFSPEDLPTIIMAKDDEVRLSTFDETLEQVLDLEGLKSRYPHGIVSFYKENPTDQIWWVDNSGESKGVHEFSFDKKKIYNLFGDYPYKLTPEEKAIFDRENPFWADFFKWRTEEGDNVDEIEEAQ